MLLHSAATGCHQFCMCLRSKILFKLIDLGLIYLIWVSMVADGCVAEWLHLPDFYWV